MLRQTSFIPYSPCIIVETVIVVSIPPRRHLQIWQTEIEKCLNNTYLTKEDKQIFLESGSQLGYLDRQMQLSSLEACMAQIEDNQNMIRKNMKEKQKLSVALGLLSGFFIIILLI